MKNSLPALISTHHSLELEAHVSPDDVIAKVYEEAYELTQAIKEGDPSNIKKEAQDLLINLVSLSSRYIDIETLSIDPSPQKIDISELVSLWGRETASIRGRYSREKINISQYRKTVSCIIGVLLPLIGSDISGSLEKSIEKFRSRVDEYLPDIHLRDHIAEYPDFPKPGILFRDISPLLAHPEALRYASYEIAKYAEHADIIAGLDARGFIFGTRVAEILGKPFVMIRKKGKLPGKTHGVDYSLEYGDNSIEVQADAIKPGEKVAIIDDLLATGGTLAAAASLVEKVGGKVESLICLISLDEPFLREQSARKSIESKYNTVGILHYD